MLFVVEIRILYDIKRHVFYYREQDFQSNTQLWKVSVKLVDQAQRCAVRVYILTSLAYRSSENFVKSTKIHQPEYHLAKQRSEGELALRFVGSLDIIRSRSRVPIPKVCTIHSCGGRSAKTYYIIQNMWNCVCCSLCKNGGGADALLDTKTPEHDRDLPAHRQRSRVHAYFFNLPWELLKVRVISRKVTCSITKLARLWRWSISWGISWRDLCLTLSL